MANIFRLKTEIIYPLQWLGPGEYLVLQGLVAIDSLAKSQSLACS